jgi:hypothetical protein
MTRIFLGPLALAVCVAACAAGEEGDDATAVAARSADAGLTGDAAGGSGEGGSSPRDEAAAPPTSGEDAGTPPDDDAAAPPDEDSGVDANAEDAGADGSTPDAAPDSAADAALDSGEDSSSSDAAPDSSPPTDAGTDAACSPTSPAFTKTYHSPILTGPFCNATQISDFYKDCLAGSTSACSTWQGANGTCNGCLSGSSAPTSTLWGPVIVYPVSSVVELDLGACISTDLLATGGSTDVKDCSADLEYLMECEHAACDAPCATDTNIADYDACQSAADKDADLCKSEYDAVYGSGTPCTKVSSRCFGGTSFETAFTAVATVMCD